MRKYAAQVCFASSVLWNNNDATSLLRADMPMTHSAPVKDNARSSVCEHCRIVDLCHPIRLDREAREALKRLIHRRRTLRRGAYLFRAGDPFHSVSALCTGSVKTCALNDGGGVQVLGFHFPGELIGMCGMGARRHPCDAVALDSTEVREIPLGRLMEVAEQVPAVRRIVYRFLGDEIVHHHALLQPLVGKMAAAEQLAAYLLSLTRRLAPPQTPAREIRLSMSRNDIGSYLGLAKETVSRLFSRFERDGLISVRTRQLRVKDPRRLASLAGASRARL